MPSRPDFILPISIQNIEDFSPEAIIKSPRTFRPQDVLNACRNVAITPPKDTPAEVLAIAQFVAIDFIALAHSTGLYNRQIKLWEALARTQKVEVHQMSKGVFNKTKLPQFDFACIDHKGRTIALARYAAAEQSGQNMDYLRDCREFFKRAEGNTYLAGVFVCYPAPFAKNVLDFIRKETNATDSLARFESVLPKLAVPVNLVEFSRSVVYDPTAGADRHALRLVHPDLSKKKLSASPVQALSLEALDGDDQPVSELE